jgi:thiol-disulfide isomerase/thioredoxin
MRQQPTTKRRPGQAPPRGGGPPKGGPPTGGGPPPGGAPARRRIPLVAIAFGLILVLGVVAVALTRNQGAQTGGTAAPGVEQTRPVQVSGGPLPPFDDTAGSDPAVGATAPELRGASFDGHPVVIAGDGKPKAILFVTHWCPHCRREVPVVERWLRSGGLPAGVELVTVSTSVTPSGPNYPPSAWLAKAGWTPPVLADDAQSSAARAYGLTSFPYFVLVDGKGKVVARTSGELEPAALGQLVAKLKAA